MAYRWDETKALELVRASVSRELPTNTPIPGDEEDLVKAGLIDSMGWVAILSALEDTARLTNFAAVWPEDRPQSIRALVETLRGAGRRDAEETEEHGESPSPESADAAVAFTGWGFALGSLRVSAEEVDRECGLATHTLRDAAGIESVCRAAGTEDELTLAGSAAEAALNMAGVAPDAVDFVVATSATFLAFPSLSASLHSRLLLPESCGAIDVGGACVGLVHALAIAKGLLHGSQRGVSLVVASEVHSRRLCSSSVPGAFRGLFGDGACAFVLTRRESGSANSFMALGDFVWGCSGSLALSLRLSLADTGGFDVKFRGEQLAAAAVSAIDRILSRLENLSGRTRSEVACFALHEPNPRIIGILAERAGISLSRIPFISRTCGNLGSATCGVSLCTALTRVLTNPGSERPLIFVAAVGPGLLWGGTYLQPASSTVRQESRRENTEGDSADGAAGRS